MTWYALAVAAQAVFTFTTERDPMDDRETYIASIGGDRGPRLAIECGAKTGRAMQVRVTPGRQLLDPIFPSMDYYERFRFDSREAIKIGVRYSGNDIILSGRNAETFLREMRSSSQAAIEITDWRGNPFVLAVPLAGSVDSADRVSTACKGP